MSFIESFTEFGRNVVNYVGEKTDQVTEFAAARADRVEHAYDSALNSLTSVSNGFVTKCPSEVPNGYADYAYALGSHYVFGEEMPNYESKDSCYQVNFGVISDSLEDKVVQVDPSNVQYNTSMLFFSLAGFFVFLSMSCILVNCVTKKLRR